MAGPAVSLQANLLESPVGNRDEPDNFAPSAPGVRISPERPRDGEALNCIIDVPSVDPEGDVVTYTYEWLQNGQSTSIGIDRVAAGATQEYDGWTCRVTPNDGVQNGDSGEASTTVFPDCLTHIRKKWNSGLEAVQPDR